MSKSNGKPGELPIRLGQVVATPAALEAIEASGEPLLSYLVAHSTGDWGDVDPEDAAANEEAVLFHARIMSVYTLSTGVKIWVITEADRSYTTVLLPSEY